MKDSVGEDKEKALELLGNTVKEDELESQIEEFIKEDTPKEI